MNEDNSTMPWNKPYKIGYTDKDGNVIWQDSDTRPAPDMPGITVPVDSIAPFNGYMSTTAIYPYTKTDEGELITEVEE